MYKIAKVKKICHVVVESTTTRTAGGLDFTAIGGKRQGREVPQSLRVEPGAKHPVWKTQSIRNGFDIALFIKSSNFPFCNMLIVHIL